MKNLFKPKSLKVCAISIAICGAALLGYNAYSNATMTPEERLFQQNLEALTDNENEIEIQCSSSSLVCYTIKVLDWTGTTVVNTVNISGNRIK